MTTRSINQLTYVLNYYRLE